MIGFHCTTPAKLKRYQATGAILPPVRFWIFESSARSWMAKTGRSVLLRIQARDNESHPLPDHKPPGHAWWTSMVHDFEVIP